MLADGPRMQAYVSALRAAVRPGCTVLDLGTGTGLFALLACQFGAAHVYAIEPDNSIRIAQASAVANGFGDRITFHQGLSTTFELAEKVDVLVSDLRGILPLYTGHIPSICDARTRFLKPTGVQIPLRDRLHVALAETPETYRFFEQPWISNSYGLDLTSGHQNVVNTWHRHETKTEERLTQPQCWADLDYTVITNPSVKGAASLTVERPGTAHGLSVWFDAEASKGIGFSNAPGEPALVYGRAFFPLQRAIAVEAGDIARVELRADHIDGDYVWTWATKIFGDGGREIKADFLQSTFYAEPIDPEKMRRHGSSFVPHPNSALDLQRLCLSLVDGKRTLQDMAQEVARTYPTRYATWQSALSEVVKIIDRAK